MHIKKKKYILLSLIIGVIGFFVTINEDVMAKFLYTETEANVITPYADSIPVDEAHFPDTAFCQFITDKYGASLTTDEIENTKSLIINSTSGEIRSLQGIEYFTFLKSLSITSIPLTEFDMPSTFNLMEFICINTGITKLDLSNVNSYSTLEVTQNTKLTDILFPSSGFYVQNCRIEFNPSLSVLDIKSNRIDYLRCAENNLSSLTFGVNAEVRYLDCTKNELSSLLLPPKSYLSNLYCSNNQLTSLDLTGYNIYAYSIGDQVQSIKVAGNSYNMQNLDSSIIGANIKNLSGTTTIDGTSLQYSSMDNIAYNYDCDGTGKYLMPVELTVTGNIWTNMSIDDWTYGETAATPSITPFHGSAEYKYSNQMEGMYSSTKPTTAGTWYVKAYVPAGVDYDAMESSALRFTINKATPAVTEPNGLTATYGNKLSDISLTGSWTWVDGDTSVQIGNSGYSARITVDDINYDYTGVAGYNSTEHYVERTFSVTVSKAVPTVTEPSGLSGTYGNKLSDISLTGNWIWVDDTTAITVINAGYTARMAVDDANYDYTGVAGYNSTEHYVERTFSVTVSKAVPTVTEPSGLSGTYGNKLSDISLTGNWTWIDDTTAVTVINAGYPARIAVDDENYDYTGVTGYNSTNHYVERTLSVTVSNALAPEVTEPSGLSGTYGDKLSDITLTGNWTWVDDATAVTVVNTGYSARISVDDVNYNYTGVTGYSSTGHYVERTLSVTVSKAVPTITEPSGLSGTYGNKLSDISLTGGWTWVDDATAVTVVNNGYSARITVDDMNYDYTGITGYNSTNHYVEKILSVTVSKAIPTVSEPLDLEGIYGESLLRVRLSGNWEWSEEKILAVGKRGYKAKVIVDDENYDYSGVEGYDSANHWVERTLSVTVSKAMPSVIAEPDGLKGTNKNKLSSVSLADDWVWVDGNQILSLNEKTYKAYLIVDDENYNYTMINGYNTKEHRVEREIKVEVLRIKATEIKEPSGFKIVSGKKISEIKLPAGWKWTNGDIKAAENDTGYLARIEIDDDNYDYTMIKGYNAPGHYVERMIRVEVTAAPTSGGSTEDNGNQGGNNGETDNSGNSGDQGGNSGNNGGTDNSGNNEENTGTVTKPDDKESDGNIEQGGTIVKPSEDGKKPDRNEDGSVNVPEGGIVNPGGTGDITLPGGGTVNKDGSVTIPEGGSVDYGNGKIVLPDGGTINRDGTISLPKPCEIIINGIRFYLPNGGTIQTDGRVEVPEGSMKADGRNVDLPNGTIINSDGSYSGTTTERYFEIPLMIVTVLGTLFIQMRTNRRMRNEIILITISIIGILGLRVIELCESNIHMIMSIGVSMACLSVIYIMKDRGNKIS